MSGNRLLGRFSGRGGEGPLTLGQQNTLAWIDQELDRFSAVVTWRFALPPTATSAVITSALAELVSRHEALRTHIAAGPRQLVLAEGAVEVELVELAGDSRSADEVADRLLARLRTTGVDFTAGLPLRLVLAVRGEKPVVLVAAYSHMAVDFASAALLAREFDRLVAGAALPPAEHQPLDQARIEGSARGRRQAANALRYWEEHLTVAPQAMCTLPPPLPPGSGHRMAFLRSAAAGRALGSIAARTGVSRQAVVVAGLSVLLCHRTGVGQSTFVAISSNRFRLRLRDYVGTLAQDGLLALDVRAGSFDDVIGRAVKASLAAYTNSIFDAAELWSVIDSVGDRRGIAFSRDFTINDISSHLGADAADQPPPAAQQPADRPSSLEWMDAAPFPTVLMCNPVQLSPEFQLALTHDTARLAGQEVENLLWAMEKLLLAAEQTDVDLTDLSAVSGLEPFVRDEDWAYLDGCWVQRSACARLLAEVTGRPVPVTVADGDLSAELTPTERVAALELIRTTDRRLAMLPKLA